VLCDKKIAAFFCFLARADTKIPFQKGFSIKHAAKNTHGQIRSKGQGPVSLAKLHAYDMYYGAKQAAPDKCQDIPLPSQHQTGCRHQLDIPATDAFSPGNPEQYHQKSTDGASTQHILHPVRPVQGHPKNPQDPDKEIDSRWDLKGFKINKAQYQQSRSHKAINYAYRIKTICQENNDIQQAVEQFHQGILPGQFSAAISASAAQEQEAEQRNQIIPFQLVPAAHAMRAGSHYILFSGYPVNADVQEAAD